MKKNKAWKILAAASSLAVIAGGRNVMDSCAGAVPEAFGYMKTAIKGEYLVTGPEECRRLLMELVSSSEAGKREEYLVTGENFEPETLIIAQMFPDVYRISNTKLREYREKGRRYVVCRIGFEKIPDGQSPPDLAVREEDTAGRVWKQGDVCERTVGDRKYRFVCIDDDYRDSYSYQKYALFLCDTVIRSDIDSTDSKREILAFGGTNNYKNSDVRAWLKKNAGKTSDNLPEIDTGVNTAFLGASVPGTEDALSETGFYSYELPFQTVKDRLFLLSLEEAFHYRNVLWEIEGGESPYNRGYWLRTPAFSADLAGNFQYGRWEYAVDLEAGCIRPAEITDGSIGICPAFCLPQS